MHMHWLFSRWNATILILWLNILRSATWICMSYKAYNMWCYGLHVELAHYLQSRTPLQANTARVFSNPYSFSKWLTVLHLSKWQTMSICSTISIYKLYNFGELQHDIIHRRDFIVFSEPNILKTLATCETNCLKKRQVLSCSEQWTHKKRIRSCLMWVYHDGDTRKALAWLRLEQPPIDH